MNQILAHLAPRRNPFRQSFHTVCLHFAASPRRHNFQIWSNLQNRADSVIFRRRVYGFSETPASVSWYDGVAKRPDTDQDNKDVGDVAEGDTIHILAPYSRRTSSLARRCDGRSAERASPAIRQRARPGSDRDVPAKLART